MRQEFINLTGEMRRQTSQNILEICKRIMPIELGTLDQTHHRGTALARTQRTSKQPIVASDGNRSDLILDIVVINRQLTITDKTRESTPAFEAVIQRLGRSCAIGDLLPIQNHPLV